MTDPTDPTDPRYDLADQERARGNAIFKPVLIGAIITLLVGLFAAYVLLRWDVKKLLPGRYNPHPTSFVRPAIPQTLPIAVAV